MKRQDVRLSPTWAALVRFPGHGLVRAKSRQEPLPAAKRLIPLPPRAPGASPRLPGPQRPPSAWSPRVSAPTRRPCPHQHQVTQLRGRPSAPRSVCSRGTRPEAGGSDGSPLLPTPAPRSTRSVSTGGRCERGNLQASVCLGSLRGASRPWCRGTPEVSCFLSALSRTGRSGRLTFSHISTSGGGCGTESPEASPESREAARF